MTSIINPEDVKKAVTEYMQENGISQSPLTLPRQGFIGASQLLPFLPFGRTTLWSWSKTGKFVKPYKISEGVTAWSLEEVHQWFEDIKASNDDTYQASEV